MIEKYYDRTNVNKAPTVFTAHLPVTFDVTVVRPQLRAYACWLVSAVVFRSFLDHDTDASTYVPMDSRFLESHLPPKVRKELLDRLVEAEVLECDHLYYFHPYYGRGPGKCRCYRLGEQHREAKIRARDVTHPELLRKIAIVNQTEREAVTDPTHLALRSWHDRVDVLLTAPAGEHHSLDRMIEGERRFKPCKQGRLHTNLSNLPRQYRQFLRLEGLELISCDVSSSQPLLLAILLERIKKRDQEGGRGHMAVCSHYSDSDLNDFLEHCRVGTVYDRIATETGYTRDQVKSRFLAVIYGNPCDMNTKVGVAIKALYPSVIPAASELYWQHGHGWLPREMQKDESRVMIGRVAARLLEEHPGMPLLTLHDSVLVPKEFVADAKLVIAQEWQDEFGVTPGLKTSPFMAPQEARPKKKTREKHARPWLTK